MCTLVKSVSNHTITLNFVALVINVATSIRKAASSVLPRLAHCWRLPAVVSHWREASAASGRPQRALPWLRVLVLICYSLAVFFLASAFYQNAAARQSGEATLSPSGTGSQLPHQYALKANLAPSATLDANLDHFAPPPMAWSEGRMIAPQAVQPSPPSDGSAKTCRFPVRRAIVSGLINAIIVACLSSFLLAWNTPETCAAFLAL